MGSKNFFLFIFNEKDKLELKMKLSMVLFALASQTQAMRLCNFFCPMILDEVCGTDGQTYGNPCMLDRERQCNNADLKVAHWKMSMYGRLSNDFDPVCGSDGVTY